MLSFVSCIFSFALLYSFDYFLLIGNSISFADKIFNISLYSFAVNFHVICKASRIISYNSYGVTWYT